MTSTRRGVRLPSTLAVVAAAVTVLAAPAAADPAGPAVTRHVDPSGAVSTGDGAKSATVSEYVAGYTLTTEGSTHRLRASLVVPDVDCDAAPRTTIGMNVGLFGRETDSEDFDLVIAGLDVTCSSRLFPVSVFTGAAPVFVSAVTPVAPGDTLTFVLTSSPGASTAAVLDADGRRLSSVRDAGFRVDDAGVLVQDDPSRDPRRTAHPPVAYSGVTFDGAPVIRSAPQRVVQQTGDGRLLAVPSAFTPDGAGFGVRRVRS